MSEPTTDLTIFDALKAEISAFVAPALVATVESRESSDLALETARQIKSFEKKVEERRKQLVAPLLAQTRLINELAKATAEDLVAAGQHLKGELIRWEQQLEAHRQEELARARAEETARLMELRAREREVDEQRRAQKALAQATSGADSLFGPDPTEDLEIRRAAAEVEHAYVEHKVHTETQERAIGRMRVSGTSKVWTFKIIDPLLVPKEYLVIDGSLIRVAIRNGVRQIPGLSIYEETRVAIR